MNIEVISSKLTKNQNIYDVKKVVNSFNQRAKTLDGIPGEYIARSECIQFPLRFSTVDVCNATHVVHNLSVSQSGSDCKINADITITDDKIKKYIEDGYKPIFGTRAIGNLDNIAESARIVTVDILGFDKEETKNEK